MDDFIHKDFLSRLKVVSGGRYLSRWLGEIGFSGSVIVGMLSRGKVPTGQTLMRLQRFENVSLSWLLLGVGTPYLVEQCQDDGECRARVSAELEAQDWSIVIATDGLHHALILSRGAEFIIKNKPPRPFTAVRIITHAGPGALASVAESANRIHILRLSETRFQALEQGRLGTYQLLGDAQTSGLLARAQPLEEPGIQTIAEQAMHYGEPSAGDGMSPDEAVLLKKYRGLSVADRNRLQTITDALAAAMKDRADDA